MNYNHRISLKSLYVLQWCVKNCFRFALQFFFLISDSLGGVYPYVVNTCLNNQIERQIDREHYGSSGFHQ